MTKASIALTDLAEKGPDVDLVREMLQLAARKTLGKEKSRLARTRDGDWLSAN